MTIARKDAGQLARGLGWLSLCIGVTELLAPRGLARGLGLRRGEKVLSGTGLREIGTGIGILTAANPTPWIWGRVAGDALDLATLSAGMQRRNPHRGTLGLALLAVGAITAVDLLSVRLLADRRSRWLRFDYSNRSGLPQGLARAHGAAGDFETPRDMRAPRPMRPYPAG
ncbi:Cyclase dehydrase [Rhodovastum atsumiense]|uniref:Cyclase dehydrase n=1 Tax=Rhodovastum atsumiense TaxID=504468 RepID=A0A5M6IQS9_9PROT|nr:cyclase dehydrase [Rhodovastum atsumiense]KAA5609918.1 cyclase dehydrase [Rhodovastum atsumiense]CAH2604534.1 Cyclase dehydrase [Rhodovastum atsumiense]